MCLRSFCCCRVCRLLGCLFNRTHYLLDYIGSDSTKPAQLNYILVYFTSITQREYSTVCNFWFSLWLMTNESSSNVMLVATTGPWFCLHLIGILLAAAFTYVFAWLTYLTCITEPSISIPTLPAFVRFMNKAVYVTIPMTVCITSLACIFLLLENLFKHIFSSLAIFKRVHEAYLIRQGLFYSRILLPLPISDEFNSDHWTPTQTILSFYDLCSLRDGRLVHDTVDSSLRAYGKDGRSLINGLAGARVYSCSPCHKILFI